MRDSSVHFWQFLLLCCLEGKRLTSSKDAKNPVGLVFNEDRIPHNVVAEDPAEPTWKGQDEEEESQFQAQSLFQREKEGRKRPLKNGRRKSTFLSFSFSFSFSFSLSPKNCKA